ncbi:hypothetical protein [Glaciimonas sp. PCH181]|uniref:hypothetical protein n=1 Tax=Glaciimonas sp. PCH181 TaxID=2133943 RepID=UPI000D3AD166|nr:hypothetical protein [Glaciimonas sp. PCH181]PUA17700.1 hypothetical protein C7W93_17660 [Glaciimonas sp. PCH181]
MNVYDESIGNHHIQSAAKTPVKTAHYFELKAVFDCISFSGLTQVVLILRLQENAKNQGWLFENYAKRRSADR